MPARSAGQGAGDWLAESPPEALRPVVVVSSADGTGVVRGTAPEGASWWVVVEGGGRLPMALLWRQEVAPGHLSAPSPVEASACRVAVAGGDGNPVAAARVVAHAAAEPDDEGRRPSVIPAWRMWRPPTRTDERGVASIVVPSGEPSELLVAAPGYRSRTSTCRPGSTSAVRLEGASAAEVELRDGAGQLLSGSLVRDRAGVPLAVTDAAGRFKVDAALLSGRLWFEFVGGRITRPTRPVFGPLPADPLSSLLVSTERPGYLTRISFRSQAPGFWRPGLSMGARTGPTDRTVPGEPSRRGTAKRSARPVPRHRIERVLPGRS